MQWLCEKMSPKVLKSTGFRPFLLSFSSMLDARKWPRIHDKMTQKTPILAFGGAARACSFLVGGRAEKNSFFILLGQYELDRGGEQPSTAFPCPPPRPTLLPASISPPHTHTGWTLQPTSHGTLQPTLHGLRSPVYMVSSAYMI